MANPFGFGPCQLHATFPVSNRTLKTATIISTVMFTASVSLFLAGYFANPRDYHFSLGDDFHISVWAHGFDSRIVLFNDAEYGPYRGSTIGLVDADNNANPTIQLDESFGDSWGICYRHFQWSDSTFWTLTVTLWYSIALFAIMPITKLVWSVVCWNGSNVAEQSGERETPVARPLTS